MRHVKNEWVPARARDGLGAGTRRVRDGYGHRYPTVPDTFNTYSNLKMRAELQSTFQNIFLDCLVYINRIIRCQCQRKSWAGPPRSGTLYSNLHIEAYGIVEATRANAFFVIGECKLHASRMYEHWRLRFGYLEWSAAFVRQARGEGGGRACTRSLQLPVVRSPYQHSWHYDGQPSDWAVQELLYQATCL